MAVGKTGAAIGLFVWCAAVVGSVDNVLRPWLVGKDTKMPDLLIFLSTLGGLMMFGILGFIIGPIVASLFVAFTFVPTMAGRIQHWRARVYGVPGETNGSVSWTGSGQPAEAGAASNAGPFP